MKAANFDYSCATSIDEACRLLAGANGEGRVIAGGQTLVPLLAMRLARPQLLVDINRIAEVRVPLWRERGRVGTGFQEVSIRRGDFALLAVAVQALFADDGICRRIAIVIGGLGGAPVRAHAAADCLVGTRLDAADLSHATA